MDVVPLPLARLLDRARAGGRAVRFPAHVGAPAIWVGLRGDVLHVDRLRIDRGVGVAALGRSILDCNRENAIRTIAPARAPTVGRARASRGIVPAPKIRAFLDPGCWLVRVA